MDQEKNLLIWNNDIFFINDESKFKILFDGEINDTWWKPKNVFNEILFSLYKYLVSIEVDPPRFKG